MNVLRLSDCNCSSTNCPLVISQSTAVPTDKDNSSLLSVSLSVRSSRFDSTLTPLADIALAAYLVLLELLAIVFNGTIILVSLWKRKTLKASDWFVVWLAFSDVGHPIVSYPMIIASSVQHAWLFGDTGCVWNGFTGFFFGVNSMTTLAAMSWCRLLVFTHPYFARSKTTHLALGLIVFSASFALFWASCPLLGWGQYGPEPYKTSCTLIWDIPDKSFVTASFIGCLAVPAGTMCYSYFRILAVVMRTRHQRMQWVPQSKKMRLWEKKEVRLLKITVIMCASFILCWTPYALVAMLKSYASHIQLWPSVSVLPALAAKTSHVADPIIYCGMNKNFSRLLPLVFRRKHQDTCQEQTTATVPLKQLVKYSFDHKT